MSTEWVVAIALVLAALAVAGLALWFSFETTRTRRLSESERYGTASLESPSWPELPSPGSLPEPAIRWGEELLPTEEGERIVWGEERQWVEVTPLYDAHASGEEAEKCPICRQSVDELSGSVFRCPNCGTLYHQSCLGDIGNRCGVCGFEG